MPIQSMFVPVKRILSMINSCETEDHLKNALNIIDHYVHLIKFKGVQNSELVRKRLMKEWKQKSFQIKMIKSFIIRHEKEFVGTVKKNKVKKNKVKIIA